MGCGCFVGGWGEVTGVSAYIPSFAKSAKDGAPEDLWLVESGRIKCALGKVSVTGDRCIGLHAC